MVLQSANGDPLGVFCHANGMTEKVPLNLFEANAAPGIKVRPGF